jgi:hypothetical protein
MSANKTERLGDVDQAAAVATASEFEGEIREFVRRDVSFRRRSRAESGSEAVEHVNSLVQRVAGASIDEIERAIAELQAMRDMLRNEGERVQREIAGYANLSQTANASMKVIADSLAQWKPGALVVRQDAS